MLRARARRVGGGGALRAVPPQFFRPPPAPPRDRAGRHGRSRCLLGAGPAGGDALPKRLRRRRRARQPLARSRTAAHLRSRFQPHRLRSRPANPPKKQNAKTCERPQEVASNHAVGMWGRTDKGFANLPSMKDLIFVMTRLQIRMLQYPKWRVALCAPWPPPSPPGSPPPAIPAAPARAAASRCFCRWRTANPSQPFQTHPSRKTAKKKRKPCL
jgi:hypothetical protein